MKKALSVLFSLLFLCSISLVAQEFPLTPGPISFKDGEVFVFLGDSITHQCLYTQYVEDYFYTRFPERKIKFINAGISGDVAADALIRFQDEVAGVKPAYVSILLGMNDGSYQKFDEGIFTTYKKDMNTLVARVKSLNATAILMAPTIFDLRQARKGKGWVKDAEKVHYNANLAYYGAWLLQKANREGLHYVDMFSPLNRLTRRGRAEDPDFTLIEDTVHPGPDGQLLMAFSMLQDLGMPEMVSEIHLQHQGGELSRVEIAGGKLGNLKGMSFNFEAESLPWVVPAEAGKGYRLSSAGKEMSREILKITGLSPGKYILKIGAAETGTYSHLQFSDGIHLEENNKTPQYQQALKVAEINKEKNGKNVKAIRDAWWRLKQVRQYEANPTPQGRKRLEDMGIADIKNFKDQFSKSLEPFCRQIAAAEAKIYAANKPEKLEYTIIPVS